MESSLMASQRKVRRLKRLARLHSSGSTKSGTKVGGKRRKEQSEFDLGVEFLGASIQAYEYTRMQSQCNRSSNQVQPHCIVLGDGHNTVYQLYKYIVASDHKTLVICSGHEIAAVHTEMISTFPQAINKISVATKVAEMKNHIVLVSYKMLRDARNLPIVTQDEPPVHKDRILLKQKLGKFAPYRIVVTETALHSFVDDYVFAVLRGLQPCYEVLAESCLSLVLLGNVTQAPITYMTSDGSILIDRFKNATLAPSFVHPLYKTTMKEYVSSDDEDETMQDMATTTAPTSTFAAQDQTPKTRQCKTTEQRPRNIVSPLPPVTPQPPTRQQTPEDGEVIEISSDEEDDVIVVAQSQPPRPETPEPESPPPKTPRYNADEVYTDEESGQVRADHRNFDRVYAVTRHWCHKYFLHSDSPMNVFAENRLFGGVKYFDGNVSLKDNLESLELLNVLIKKYTKMYEPEQDYKVFYTEIEQFVRANFDQ